MSITDLHHKAMTLAEEAYEAQQLGEAARARELFALAFEQERTAAREITKSAGRLQPGSKPTFR